MPFATEPDGGGDPVSVSSLLGLASSAPAPLSSPSLVGSAPTVSDTPIPGQGVATDGSGNLPVSVAAQSVPLLQADPVAALIGQIWYRQDLSQLSVRHDGSTTKRVSLSEIVTAAYTPTWSATGVAPALGNGTLVGKYAQTGTIVVVQFALTAGSTTTFGTGAYSFSLPTGVLSGQSFFGGGQCYLSGGGSASQVCWREDGTLVLNQLGFSQMSGTNPIALANGSQIHGNLVYLSA